MATKYDPFSRPIPGESLTDDLGSRTWETPPTFTDPDELLNTVLSKLEDQDRMDAIMDLVYAGTPIETIVNTWGIESFSRGDATPDVVELVKPTLSLVLMDQALNRNMPVQMFNDSYEEKQSKRMAQTMNVLKDSRPEEFDALKASITPAPEPVVNPDEELQGLIPKRGSK